MARTVGSLKASTYKQKSKTAKGKKHSTTRQKKNQVASSPSPDNDLITSDVLPTRHHGASHKGLKINQWEESHMINALNEFEQEKHKPEPERSSIRSLARAWNVPYATLRKRIFGFVKARSKQSVVNRPMHCSGRPTVLSDVEEDELATHLRSLAAVGFPCSREDVRRLAFDYAVSRGIKGFSSKKGNAGYYWFLGFMGRHPELSIKKAENLSIARAMGMNKQQVFDWFTKYKELSLKLGIFNVASHIWNADETGCQNIYKSQQVIGEVGRPTYNITATEKGETSTALVCINAFGVAVPPMIIHKGMKVGQFWSNGARHNVMVRASESGYINKDLFLEFGKSFVNFLHTAGLVDGLPHLLLLDSHYSHLYNLEFLELMRQNQIHVFAIPAHTSHWLQPLDRGVFRSFKQGWQTAMKTFTRNTAGRKVEKKDFFVVFNDAWDYGITTENSQGGFRGSGILPWNPNAIPQHAYAPSSTTERELSSINESGPSADTAIDSVVRASSSNSSEPSQLTVPATDPLSITTDKSPANDVRPEQVVASEPANSNEEIGPLTIPATDPMALTTDNSSTNDVRSEQVVVSEVAGDSGLVAAVCSPSFDQLLPFPKRTRPAGACRRKKPPNYELTSDETVEFVREASEAKLKKETRKRKSEKVQTKADKKLLVNQAKTGKLAGRKRKSGPCDKHSKPNTVAEDRTACSLCGYRYGDNSDPLLDEEWRQCTACLSWWHETCSIACGLQGISPKCDNCKTPQSAKRRAK